MSTYSSPGAIHSDRSIPISDYEFDDSLSTGQKKLISSMYALGRMLPPKPAPLASWRGLHKTGTSLLEASLAEMQSYQYPLITIHNSIFPSIIFAINIRSFRKILSTRESEEFTRYAPVHSMQKVTISS